MTMSRLQPQPLSPAVKARKSTISCGLGIKDRTFRRYWNDGFKWPEYSVWQGALAEQHRTQKHRLWPQR
jgi:hypothetical protein